MKELKLRRADKNDSRFLFALRNDEEVRKNSFQTGEIPYEQHEAWFERKLSETQTKIFVLEKEEQAIGQVRVEIAENAAEISYALCREFRGKGYAKWMLAELERMAAENNWCDKLTAEVKRENAASKNIFRYLEYTEKETEFGCYFEKALPMFTVIMCTRQSARTLEKAVSSVKAQSFPNWELRILDNGSEDGTVEELERYGREDDRIHCIFRKDNVGWPKGISICLTEARGKYMMFLGADDYLPADDIFETVANEVKKHEPDIIWTGNEYALLENGKYQTAARMMPSYRVYEKEEKLAQYAEIMQSVYYNSVMHYIKISFLKKHRIDFYSPYYGDCQGMTEALARAEKMLVLDRNAYVLTVNTSQTAGKVCYDYDMERQWKSIKAVAGTVTADRKAQMAYVADRVLKNMAAMCEEMLTGVQLRDNFMNDIEKSLPERFWKVEQFISTDSFGEMAYYAGREKYEEQLLGAAGVLYWECKKYGKHLQIRKNSPWLADFAEHALQMDEAGRIAWRENLETADEDVLIRAMLHSANPHHIGCELMLREEICYTGTERRKQLQDILDDYLKTWENAVKWGK